MIALAVEVAIIEDNLGYVSGDNGGRWLLWIYGLDSNVPMFLATLLWRRQDPCRSQPELSFMHVAPPMTRNRSRRPMTEERPPTEHGNAL